jgi:hypothetical protein
VPAVVTANEMMLASGHTMHNAAFAPRLAVEGKCDGHSFECGQLVALLGGVRWLASDIGYLRPAGPVRNFQKASTGITYFA